MIVEEEVMEEKITVAHLVVTLDRIEQWMQVLRKGLEALPQDQEISIDESDFPSGSEPRQPYRMILC